MRILAKQNRMSLAISIVIGGLASVSPTIHAQKSDTKRLQIDEVIVTAEKRAQNLQEVPVAISAFTEEMMEARGIETPQDLQLSVPSLVIGEQYQGPAKVTIRGIGSENVFPGGDPGVPLHINGHYAQSTAYVLRDMLDVDRVEVLRGPQGTLYGRNAIGGSINIITKRPTEKPEGKIKATIGNYDKRNLQMVVSGPLSSDLYGRLAVSDDKRDGYVENVGHSGDDRETSDYTSIRGALLYDLSNNLELYLNAYYFDDTGNPAQRFISEYPTGPLFGGPNYYELNNVGKNPTLTDPFKVSQNSPSKQVNKSKGVSLDINWNLGEVELRSLSAYDDTSYDVIADSDGSSMLNYEFAFFMPFKTFTQELQALSTGTERLDWVVGAFYYHEESSYSGHNARDQFSTDVNGDGVIDQNDPRWFITIPGIEIDAKSIGVYGQVNYSLIDNFELVGGLRYSDDKKKADGKGISIGVEGVSPPPPILALGYRDDNWSELTGKVGLNYHLKEDVMLYASYSRGYKAGGFNLLQVDSYDPERVNAYEIGLKATLLSDRAQMNIATFYYDYQDKQDFQRFNTPGGVRFWIVNASAATISGAELEMQAYLTNELLVDISLSYLSAEFEEFESIDSLSSNPNPQDLSGNKLPFSPEWNVHMGVQYNWVLGGGLGVLSARGDYSWVEKQYSNAFNRDASSGLSGSADFVPSYHMVSARLQWESVNSDWRATLYAKNITNEEVLQNPFVHDANITFATYLPPRTYSLTVEYSF